tara:strand:+ start:519 stop:1118 length:600 start_codon:yes stop_codon:yes gene_type:complete
MKFDFIVNILLLIIIILIFYFYFLNHDSVHLKCIISNIDGMEYCVRRRKDEEKAADLLANTINKCKKLVQYMKEKYPDKENVKRLVNGFKETKIKETLPTSKFKAYSENKGKSLAFCLNVDGENDEHLIDDNTLLFVALHEISHIMTVSIGHKDEFWDNFKFVLENAKEAGIHKPSDYKKNPKEYCGMKITDNPYYDRI